MHLFRTIFSKAAISEVGGVLEAADQYVSLTLVFLLSLSLSKNEQTIKTYF